MKASATSFGAELRHRWRELFRQPLALFSIFLVPLLSSFLLLYMMEHGLPTDMPVAVVNEDHSASSRAIVRTLDAFQSTHVALEANSMPEALATMRRGEVYGIYHIPPGLQAKAGSSRQPTIHYYTNSAYLMAGSFVFRDMKMLSELVSAKVGLLTGQARGKTEEEILATIQPIAVRSEVMSNPWLNYAAYLTTTILPGLLQLMIFLYTAYSIGREVKRGTAQQWLQRNDGSIARSLLTKLLPQTVCFLLVGWGIQLILYIGMGYPLQAGGWTMALAMLLLVLSAQALAIFFFALIPTVRMAMSLSSLLGMLSFSISGMSVPVSSMIAPMQALSFIFPLRYYYNIGISQALLGAPWLEALPYYLGLTAFLLLPILLLPRLKRYLIEVPYLP